MPNRDSKRAAPFGRLSLLRVPVTRREFALRVLGGMGTVAVLARGGADGAAPAASAGGMDAGTAGAACKVYPQETEGPYYLDLDLLRSDITEGRAGTPLALVMQVVSATTCAPLKGVAVDVWHCDAAGVYSGYSGQLGGADTRGQTFLRGTQLTGDDGRVRFDTIYPGWYPGRTTHVYRDHRTPIQPRWKPPALAREPRWPISLATRERRQPSAMNARAAESAGANRDPSPVMRARCFTRWARSGLMSREGSCASSAMTRRSCDATWTSLGLSISPASGWECCFYRNRDGAVRCDRKQP